MEKIVKLQLALFFESPVPRPDNFYIPINSDMGNLFDEMPQIIPIPMDAPHDIPRVQLHSGDNRYHCNIAASRIDFIYNGNNEDEDHWGAITKDFLAKVKLFVNSSFRLSRFIRFGLIGNFFIPDRSSSTTITRKYLKIDLNSAEEINFRFNKRSESHGLKLNNITSINTALSENKGVSKKGIYVELDVNNVPSGETLSSEKLLQLIEKQIPNFSPERVKGLVK